MDLLHQFGEVTAGEFPLEGGCDALVVVLKLKDTIFYLLQGREVVGSEDLPLDYGEVNFDLVEPTRVNRTMHKDDVGEGSFEASNGLLSAVRGAIVHDPENPTRVTVGRLGHDLGDKAVERLDAGGLITASEDLCAVNIECRQVSPGTAALVFVFYSHGLIRACGQGRVLSNACLDAGFLIGRKHEVIGFQGLAFPLPGVEVEDASRLLGELGVAREYPGAVMPRADGVLVNPAPHGFIADGGNDTTLLGIADDIRRAQA